jgi:hypothetical protein
MPPTSTRSLAERLAIRPGHTVAVRGAPAEAAAALLPLPDRARFVGLEEGPDVIVLFARDRADLEQHAPAAIEAAADDRTLWICYPKRSSKVPTDLNRDVGWQVVADAGLRGVSQVSVDDTWSALRFRHQDKVGRR